jgi:ribosome-associated protein
VTLQVMPGFVIADGDLMWRFSRSSGPGGQSVNTTDSRAELSVDVVKVVPEHLQQRALSRLEGKLVNGVLTIAASEHRSQLQNRQAAAERMAQQLREAIAAPPPPRRATKPTRGSKERRLKVKGQRSALKQSRRSRPDD